ncbi:MAG TPA: pirin family protein [Mycobacteriales bacterium]|nr:pirin family protein [Mycobacteriales bacterium]
MPAVSVSDPTTLPRIGAPLAALQRPVRSITTAPHGLEGEGFPVRRAFAGVDLADLDPFIHLDQMGEVDYGAGEPKGTPWHPHRGFETVTYMIDGVLRHNDSLGGGGLISDGDTQWMTAGQGILHIETPPEDVVAKGGLFHGLQLWVNLPRAQKLVPARYQDLSSDRIGLLASADAGALLRLIAGNLGDLRGPGSTYTPMTMVHATVSPGASLSIPWPVEHNALVYILAGRGTVGPQSQPIRTGQLALLVAGEAITVAAEAGSQEGSPTMEVLLLGGRRIGEPVAWGGPFVMNTEAEVREAFADFQAGRLGQVPAVHGAPTDLLVTETSSPLD